MQSGRCLAVNRDSATPKLPMRKIQRRQYKLTQIRGKKGPFKGSIKAKKGRRGDARLDRRGR